METDVGMIYLRTIPGFLKIIETILAGISFLCAMIHTSSWASSPVAFLKIAGLMSLCYCIAIILFRIVHCTKGCPAIPWNKLDCICSLFLAILLLVSAIMMEKYDLPAALKSSTIFAYACSSFFVLDTFYKILYLLH